MTGVRAGMWHRNGTESRDLLPLWKEDGVAIPFRKLLEMVLQERRNRNGTESRDLLPLWKEDGVAIPFRKLLEMVLQERRNRNGTESRDLLPLWEDDTGKGMPQITVRRPSRPDAVPDGGQRSG